MAGNRHYLHQPRDEDGQWTDSGGGGKKDALVNALRGATQGRPLTHSEIAARIKGSGGSGTFSDKFDLGQTLRELERDGVIKRKWMHDRKAHGYYPKSAKPKPEPTKAPTRQPVAAKTAVPKEVSIPDSSSGRKEFVVVSRSGGPQRIKGASLEDAVRKTFGDDAEIRETGELIYVYKNGRMVARIKRPDEKQFHGPLDYLNRNS